MLTKEQRQQRRQWVGGSDVAAIMGLSPFGVYPYDVWLEKTGRIPDTDVSTPEMSAGSYFEVGVLNWAEHYAGERLLRGMLKTPSDIDCGIQLGVNLDAVGAESGEPFEAKTTGLFGPVFGTWGDGGTDKVPPAYVIQCHAAIIATGANVCHLPAFIGGRGFSMFHIGRSDALVDMIFESIETFWRCVQTDTPPDDKRVSLKVLKQIERDEGKRVRVEAGVVNEWLRLKEKQALLNKLVKDAEGAVVLAMGDGDCADIVQRVDASEDDPSYGRELTFKKTERKAYTKRVEASSFRSLKAPKARKVVHK